MKRFLAVALAILLLTSTMIPAYAVPYDADWIPPVPDFITSIKNGFQMDNVGMPYQNQEFGYWFDDLLADGAVILFLLDQGVYNRYNEENGIEYDRQFSVYMLAPDKKPNGKYYDMGGFMHKGGPRHQEQMNTPSPMLYMCLNNPHTFQKFIYDQNTKQLVPQTSLSHLPAGASLKFTYVLAVGDVNSFQGNNGGNTLSFVNGTMAESSDVYPGFTRICGNDFEVGTSYHQFVDGKAVNHWRDYDWWLGIKGDPIPSYNENFDIDKDTNGDGKPDLNVDTNGDGKPDINIDTDGDGKPDINIDTNGDKKPDINIDTNGDNKPDLNIDTDGDGKPDLNIDTNGDGKPDLNIDTNGDGKPDLNIDTNGDGKPDLNIDTNGDGKPDLNIDTDGDGKPDLNIDTDGDGKPDVNVDVDGDGKPDVNIKPGGGSSSGGGSSDGDGDDDGPGGNTGGGSSGQGSGHPSTWLEDDDQNLNYSDWSFFDPYASQYNPFSWDKNYDPLEGYEPVNMPDFPRAGNPNYEGRDPFDIPNDKKFGDLVIEFDRG